MNLASVKAEHQIRPIELNVSLVGTQHQKMWGRLAVINFAFGSAGAASYLLSLWFYLLLPKELPFPALFVIRLVAAGCVSFGLLAVGAEAGRPFRARFLLGNLQRSWMSRETLAAILFVPLALLTSIVHSAALSGLAAASAGMFIISQGFILYRSRAIPAWNMAIVPSLFITSAFAGGSGLLLIVSQEIAAGLSIAVLLTFAVCAAVDLFLWGLYLYWPTTDLVEAATEPLRKGRSILWIIGAGRILPMFLLLIALLPDPTTTSQFSLTIAGVALFMGSWSQKEAIIRGCGYLVPIGLQLELSQ